MLPDLVAKTGTIQRVFFHRIGFSAGTLQDDEGKIEKFAGILCAKEGRRLTVFGRYENNKYGRQFYVNYVKPEIPITLKGLAKYLAIRPDVKGVGPSKAKKIVAEFGFNFEEILLTNSEQIINFANLLKNSLSELKASWNESKGWNQIYAWLASFDLSYFQIEKLVKSLGCECPFLLKEDPYALIEEIKGIGFLKMDKIALKLGFDKTFLGRLSGALKHAVHMQLKSGHCWTELNELQRIAIGFLDLNEVDYENTVRDAVVQNISNGTFSHYLIDKEKKTIIGFSRIEKYERALAEFFSNQKISPHVHLFENEILFNQTYFFDGLGLNRKQFEAVRSALKNNVSIISGGAGTGKTYTIRAINEMYKSKKLLVKMAAPTGKAARRIEEITGVKASTLHRLMGYNGSRFEHERGSFEILADVLIVDEISMVDVELFWHLLESLNFMKTCLVLVGDHNQLPPVGPGHVLRDLMETQAVSITVLDKVMRQAGTLKENSSAILKCRVEKSMSGLQRSWYLEDYHSDPLQLKEHILKMFNRRFEDLGFHILYDVQVLSPTHKGPIGATQLNADIRYIIQKKLFNLDIPPVTSDEKLSPKFYKHDKVIQTVNDYKNDVMNGEVGFVTEISTSGDVTVQFNGHKKPTLLKYNSEALCNIQLGYCLSIHKVQGSQFPCVVSIIHKSHSFMHHQNLLYTAVTRADKTAMIVGDKWGIQNCASKVETMKRRTFLSLFMSPQLQL